CATQGCVVCGWTYYCVGQDDQNRILPTPNDKVVIAGATDIKGRPAILTNFLEPSQFKNRRIDRICTEITKVPSNQDTQGGKWHYGVQGTHKRAISLIYDKRYLDLLATWEPTDKRLLPQFESQKVDLCKKALQSAADNTHSLAYGAFNAKSVASVKNRHTIAISTPPFNGDTKSSKRSRAGNIIAFINTELGDHNKDVGLFNANGLLPP
ncbi:hypothetical protein GQ44DRAFT_622297, partial [Phaeosphaeriaceae sp. PMI808]